MSFRLIWLLIGFSVLSACTSPDRNLLENDQFRITLDDRGKVTELIMKNDMKNLLIPNEQISFLTIQNEGNDYGISSWKTKGERIHFLFDDLAAEIVVDVTKKEGYLTLEIVEINCDTRIDKLIFGPYQVVISEKIGQSIGVAYDDEKAIGLMGLNLKSRGGFEERQRRRYGNAALKTEDGASLTAFVRDRTFARISANFEEELGEVLPLDKHDPDRSIEGAKFAFYCVPAKNLTSTIEKIILNEDLPYIKTNGEWNKTSNYSTSSKFIMSFNVDNIDDCISIASKGGMTCIYHGSIFSTWGNFEIPEEDFPEGYNSVRVCADKAERHGINLGAHVLTNFITTNDPYVSPKPHKGLVLSGVTELAQSISATDNTIVLKSESVRPAYEDPNREKVNPRWRKHRAIRIGDEIIEYNAVSKSGTLRLEDCKRGAFGTQATEHTLGDKVGRLASHGYKVFFPDIALQDSMAINLAEFFNVGNLKRISFDGVEGGLISGHGRYGGDRFIKVFFDHLDDPHILANSSDVSHFGWHYFANESWGEPWTSNNFRESHLDHRIKVQKALKEDLLPTKMGQFSLKDNTSKKDIEWVMGLCAGYDAGVDFYVSHDFDKTNKEAEAILAEIKRWEEARQNGLFSEEQKEKLRDPYTFYSMNNEGDKIELIFVESWAPEGGKAHALDDKNTLASSIMGSTEDAPVSYDFKHIHQLTEPGQPTAAIWKYYCAGPTQNLHFVIRLPKDAIESIKGLYMKVGTQKVEIPHSIQPGEYIVNNGSNSYSLYSSNGQLKSETKVTNGALPIQTGENVIEFDYQGNDRKAGPEVLVNFRTQK